MAPPKISEFGDFDIYALSMCYIKLKKNCETDDKIKSQDYNLFIISGNIEYIFKKAPPKLSKFDGFCYDAVLYIYIDTKIRKHLSGCKCEPTYYFVCKSYYNV